MLHRTIPFLVVASIAACGSTPASSNAAPDNPPGSSGSNGPLDPDGGTDGPAISTVTADAACVRYAEATTARLETCYPRAFSDLAYDGKTLLGGKPWVKAQCLAALSGTGSQVKPSNFAACADALNALTCGAYFDQVIVGALAPAACVLPRGTLPNGSSCATDSQCAGRCKIENAYYLEQKVKNCGVCADVIEVKAAPPGEVGAPCGNGAPSACRRSLQCDYWTKKCLPWPAVGSRCADSSGCNPEHVCEAATSTCQPRPIAGETCRPSGAAESSCAAAFYCAADNTCAARVRVGPGDACHEGRPCTDGECTASHTCPAVVGKGAACSGFTLADCASPLFCGDGTCSELAPPRCN